MSRSLLVAGLAFLTIHWLNQWFGTYELMFDEAQYWFWGQHPAWGYYSKPPVLGWLIALSTGIFGDTDFGVRVLSPLLLLATGALLYATSRRLHYAPRTAAWVFITYLTLPVVTGNGNFFTTDVPLAFFWALALYGVIRALESPAWWLLAGLAAGFGLLSKYTMVAFAASVLLMLLLTPQRRKLLATAMPWVAGVAALAVFAPNLWWNAHHQFVTFQHTNANVFSKQIEIYPGDMLAFMGAQFGIFGPILLVALLLSLRGLKRDSTAALLHCFVWPLAIAGIVVALMAGAQAHWIGPSYLAATLIVVPWLESRAQRWLKVSLLLHLVVLALFYAAPSLLPHLPLKRDPLARLFVWNHLAAEVGPIAASYPDAVLVTDERKIAAALTYALRKDLHGTPVYKWNPGGQVHDHYDMLTAQKPFTDRQLLLVTRNTGLGLERQHVKQIASPSLDGFTFSVYLIPRFTSY